MTDKQNAERWKARYDYLEKLHSKFLAVIKVCSSEDEARNRIRTSCERALKLKGFNYPFSEDEK